MDSTQDQDDQARHDARRALVGDRKREWLEKQYRNEYDNSVAAAMVDFKVAIQDAERYLARSLRELHSGQVSLDFDRIDDPYVVDVPDNRYL